MLEIAERVVALVGGVSLVAVALLSAIRTFVLPRGVSDPLPRALFLLVRVFFDLRAKRARDYAERDRIMAMYAPVSLLLLPAFYLGLTCIGYTAVFWAAGAGSWRLAFTLSGSSILTLGFATGVSLVDTLLVFSEATIGLTLVALVISYLPTMYGAFSRRENAVTMLEVRAGTPPSAVVLIERYNRLHSLDRLNELWTQWEIWFADIEETHTSFGALAFFRSPQPDHSWVTAAGTVLDAASLANSTVATPHDVQADLCLRAGYISFRRICDFYQLSHDPAPRPDDPISIARVEFDAAYDDMAAAGVPLEPDRDKAWRAFAGWRVNYDQTLLALASLTMAPLAPWSSDRSLRPRSALRRIRPSRRPRSLRPIRVHHSSASASVRNAINGAMLRQVAT